MIPVLPRHVPQQISRKMEQLSTDKHGWNVERCVFEVFSVVDSVSWVGVDEMGTFGFGWTFERYSEGALCIRDVSVVAIWAIYCAKNIVGGLARRFTTLPENPRRSSKIHSGSLTVYKNTRKLVRQDAARARSCGVRKFNILTWVLAISQVDTQSSRLIDDHRWCGLSYFLSTLKVSCNNVTSSFSVSILNLECSCTRSTGPSTSCLPVIGLSSC